MPRSSAPYRLEHQGNSFGERLKVAIEARGWTAAETARRVREHLGEGAKFTQANIGHYITGRSRPRVQYSSALRAVLGEFEEYFVDNNKKKTVNGNGVRHLTEVEPSAENFSEELLPFLHVEDRGSEAWLQINQQVPWPVALKVLQALKGEG